MPFTALLFSGGLDSVAFGILLAREGHEVEPCYVSHRHGGNTTKKEAVTASKLARDVCGRPLVVVKAPTAREGWWDELGDQVIHAKKRLPIPKNRKDWRNRIFVQVLRDVGILPEADHVALAVLGVEGETEFLAKDAAESLLDSVSAERMRDVDHEDIERDTHLAPGQLITPIAMGISGKVGLLRAVGRGQKNRELCWASESCLMYFNTHCGNCSSCKGRAQAFMAAWGEDRTKYRKGTFAWHCKRGR